MRRRIVLFTLIAASAVLCMGGPAAADSATLVAYMTGAEERPNPGDPDGVGRAVVTIDDDTNTICVATQFTGIAMPLVGYHIHIAPPGAAGPVVVPFTPPTTQNDYQCRVVSDEALLDNIAANPHQYYINLHNQPFPGAALRGQLQHA